MSVTASDILHDADTFRRAYPSWPHPEPEERAMTTDYDEIKVSAMVTVTLTPAQAQAYADEHGNVFVSLDVRARLGAEMTEALEQHPWLRDHMSVEISKPVIVKGWRHGPDGPGRHGRGGRAMTKPPTPQAISALLRKAGFTRALNSFAMRPEDAGFVILGKVGPPGGLTVEHVSYRGASHLAELNRYSAVLTGAGYRCEHSSTNSLIVTAGED